mmetsp:Transcript_27539/g.88408  ORF Transcript_27539/g.88408 Transcript_27539/m.88408 type:complete len:610 (+) Transcript_27539:297-2126(+)
MRGSRLARRPSLEEEELARERHLRRRLTHERRAVRSHLERLWADGDLGHGRVVDHVRLGDGTRARDRLGGLAQPVPRADARRVRRARDEGERGAADGAGLRAKHRPHHDGLRRRDGGVRVAHLRPRDGAALDDHLGLCAKQRRLPHDKVGEHARLHRADGVRHPVGEGGVDRVLCNVPLDSRVVRARRRLVRQRPALRLHLVGRLPCPADHLADAAHRLRVGRHDGDGTHVVQDVLRGDRLAADARLGKGDVLRDRLVEVVADHEHVEVLVDRVDGEGAGRVGGGREDVRLGADLDDVGRVAAARALGVVGVDRPSLDGGERVVDEPRLVERVCVDGRLHVVLVAKGEAGVDCGGGGAPVLVQLEARRAGLDHLEHPLRVGRVPLAREAKVERERVGRAQHRLDLARRRRAGGGAGAGRRPRPAAVHSRDARRDRLLRDLRANPVHVRVDGAGGDNHLFARDSFGRHAGRHARRDALHRVRVARLADADDARPLDPDVRLDHPQRRVDDERVRDDHVERVGRGTARLLAHPLAQHLAAAKLDLLAVDGVVLLHFGQQARVAQPHPVAHRRPKHRRVLWPRHHQRRAGARRRGARRVPKAARGDALHDLG